MVLGRMLAMDICKADSCPFLRLVWSVTPVCAGKYKSEREKAQEQQNIPCLLCYAYNHEDIAHTGPADDRDAVDSLVTNVRVKLQMASAEKISHHVVPLHSICCFIGT